MQYNGVMIMDKSEQLLKQCYWLLSAKQRFKIALTLYKGWALKCSVGSELTIKRNNEQ